MIDPALFTPRSEFEEETETSGEDTPATDDGTGSTDDEAPGDEAGSEDNQ